MRQLLRNILESKRKKSTEIYHVMLRRIAIITLKMIQIRIYFSFIINEVSVFNASMTSS